MKVTKEQSKEIVKLYKEGMDIKHVAHKFSITKETVVKYLKKGIPGFKLVLVPPLTQVLDESPDKFDSYKKEYLASPTSWFCKKHRVTQKTAISIFGPKGRGVKYNDFVKDTKVEKEKKIITILKEDPNRPKPPQEASIKLPFILWHTNQTERH